MFIIEEPYLIIIEEHTSEGHSVSDSHTTLILLQTNPDSKPRSFIT